MAPQGFWTRPLPVLILLSLLATLIYSNTFSSPFHLDDMSNIVQNLKIRDLSNFIDFSGSRYIGFLSFALNYYFGGLEVFGYHLVNLLIHITNGFLVYLLVLLLFRSAHDSQSLSAPWIALVTALLFVAHPIQTQAVTYIIQRLASLAALFYLLAVVAYLKWRMVPPGLRSRYGWYAVALLSTVLAMKTKENSFTLPFMLLLVEGIFFRPITLKKGMALIPFLLTLPIIPLARADRLGEAEVGLLVRQTDIIPMPDYLFTQFRVIVTYLRLLLFPIHQNLDYDYPVYHSLFHPAVFFSFLLLFGLFALAVYLLIRSQRPSSLSQLSTQDSKLISFGILWFFLALSVESSVIPIRDVIFEHRLYLPSIGFFLASTVCVFSSHRALEAGRPRGDILSFLARPTALGILVFLILMLLAVATYQRNRVWKNDLTLWEDVVSKAPGKARGHNGLGAAYQTMGRSKAAIQEYQTAVRLIPNYLEPHYNLGLVYQSLGRFEEAIQEYQTVLRLNPDFFEAHSNLGIVYKHLGRFEKAIQEYERALTLNPQYVSAYINLGSAYHAQGRFEEAARNYREALRLSPDFLEAHNNLGLVYQSLGRFEEAIQEYQTVLRLNPDFFEAHSNLGIVYKHLGRFEKAIQEYERALTLNPQYVSAYINLGSAYHAQGRFEEAARNYREALRLDPDSILAHINLGVTYHAQGRLEEAIGAYGKALTLSPQHAQGHYYLGLVYRQQGRIREAKEEFERALKLKPDYTIARQALKSLSR
jgi:tetratricopeptide (TPR) repeat protein